MKVIILSTLTLVFLMVVPAMAEEGYMCDFYYKATQRKAQNIKSYGTDLSKIAKDKLFSDIQRETVQCIAECEGEKFKYCNEVAKWISK